MEQVPLLVSILDLHLYLYQTFSDNPTSVQLVVTEVTSQVAEADSLMQAQDPSSDTYQSLQTIKNMMETLASALQSYLSLLLSGRRMRRNTVIVQRYLLS